MAIVLYNKKLSNDFYLLKAAHIAQNEPGQFYMLRAWGDYPVLSRPISVFDADGGSVTFLYKIVGKGTEFFSKLMPGDQVTLNGPYGNGFPDAGGKIALVGGGAGIAPLYYAAKRIRENRAGSDHSSADVYLGFSDTVLLTEEFSAVSDKLVTDIGGFITDKIEPKNYDYIFTCGPNAMMRALYEKCVAQNASGRLYVSLENRMACGIGACLVCTCKTKDGNKKICSDGPVFTGEAVFSL